MGRNKELAYRVDKGIGKNYASLSKKTLLIVGDAIVAQNGTTFSMGNPMNRLYEALSKYFNIIKLSAPTKKASSKEVREGYVTANASLVYKPRPFYSSVEDFLRKSPFLLLPTLSNLKANIKRCDIILIRLPTPVGLIAFLLSRIYRKQVMLQLKGKWTETVWKSRRYKWVMKPLALGCAYFFHLLDRFMIKRAPTLVHGAKAREEYKELNEKCFDISTSLISEDDIHIRKDTCNNPQVRLLFVGRLSPAKGLQYLLESLKKIQSSQLELRIVGEGKLRNRLKVIVKKGGLDEKVHFLGQVPFGKKLFEVYKNADIFVLPSISEGIPKVLFEAMAFGVPIIATRVGGIPDIIEDRKNGLLIESKSPKQIKKAVETLIKDSSLRRKIIRKGYKTVRKFTIESQAAKIASIIQTVIDEE